MVVDPVLVEHAKHLALQAKARKEAIQKAKAGKWSTQDNPDGRQKRLLPNVDDPLATPELQDQSEALD